MAIIPIPLTDQNIPRVIALHDLYRGYVKNEDSLINYRTTWLITLQTILFGIYGFTSQKNADILTTLITSTALGPNTRDREKAISSMILDHNSHLGSSLLLLDYIIDWTPIIGILLCVSFIISIGAAYRACSEVKRHAVAHAEAFTALSLPGITGGGAFGIPFLGSVASFFVPFAMICFWFCARFIISLR